MTDKTPADNRRRDIRRTAIKGGKIVFNHGQSVLECRIRDLSTQGARLELIATQLLPHQFELHMTGGIVRRCELRWARGALVGVQFENETD